MRKLMMAISTVALLAACQPAGEQQTETPAPGGPQVAACNNVTPSIAMPLQVQDETAVASTVSDLRGGRITPGTYDLASARRIGDATGWQGGRAVALDVRESAENGTVFNWASVAENGAGADTWTAQFTDTPEPQLTYTCGRTGTVEADFSATPNALELRLPDGANGALLLSFQRRG